jgi:glutamate-1-semialdehyde aminotransferase
MRSRFMDCHAGIDLYKRAKQIIPGGTQLLSKRPEMFLPEQWPSYYSKCKGVEIRDLDGNKFIDMSICGVGACILGYADPDVDKAVKGAINRGTISTLNCPEEIELAELLCSLHPWAEMARFARCGGEAMAVAVRIARAATGRDKVAFCGYHGWHDWYLSANLADNKNLDGQLLRGLEPAGVPRSMMATAIPFFYNKPETLNAVVNEHRESLAAIVMEPVRHSEPEDGFLKHVRETANRIGAVLIFDEVTSGWRMNIGGIHLLHGVNPDIAVFAKGMSNGYPMAAVIGVRPVMEAAQKSFISSTYWTEGIGPVAALTTIKKMQSHNVPEHLCQVGSSISEIWKESANGSGLNIKVHGIPPLSVFSFDHGEVSQAIHTLFTQEMLNRGFLASKAFYATYAHKDRHVNAYAKAVRSVFKVISGAIKNGTVEKLLNGPVSHTGFKRLA